jgi:hypothetical protein
VWLIIARYAVVTYHAQVFGHASILFSVRALVQGREVIHVHVLACLLCHLLVNSRNNWPIARQGHSQEIKQTETETLGTFGQNQCRCCTVPLL